MLLTVTSTDAATCLGVSFLLAGITLASGYLPARRPTQVDPIAALRHE